MATTADPGGGSAADPAGGFTADPSTLTSASARFSEEADALQSALSALVGRLQADGACWGTDAEGATFGAVYQPNANQMLSDLADLVAGLQAASTALGQSAQQYQAADQASAMAT